MGRHIGLGVTYLPGWPLVPARAPRPCATPGCPVLVVDGAARCVGCRATRDRARGTRHERGYDAAWIVVERAYLVAHPTCVRCGAPATQADHIVPLRRGGARLDPANLRALCGRCHRRRTALDSSGWGRT